MPLPTPTPTRINLSHVRLLTSLAVAAALTNGSPVSQVIPIAGCPAGRVRWKSTCAGTLKGEFCSSDGETVYATAQPASVAIVANTENYFDFNPRGEAYFKITFTPSADGAVTFCDVCGL